MPRTVIEIIKRAHRLIGVYSLGETPTADESVDGLTALNGMLDEWAAENLMSSVQVLDTISLAPGTGVYTLGATGTVVTGRPDTIDESSYIDYLGVSSPMTVVTLDEYNALVLKGSSSSMPFFLWYNPTFPNGTLTVYPTPSIALTLKLWSHKPIAYVNLTDTVALPPAYENAITFNLACILAVEFSMPVSAMLAKNAVTSKKKVKRRNYQPMVMDFRGDLPARNAFNINTGAAR